MSNKQYIYDITISKRDGDDFKILKSIGTSSGNLDSVISKFVLDLYKFLQEEHKVTQEELDNLVKDDDIPF